MWFIREHVKLVDEVVSEAAEATMAAETMRTTTNGAAQDSLLDQQMRQKDSALRGWQLREAIRMFHEKEVGPSGALEELQRRGWFRQQKGQSVAAAFAAFLHDHRDSLDKGLVGEYLSKEALCSDGSSVLREYLAFLDFGGMMIDEAMRVFLSGLRLPGEAQIIDRLLENFAERYGSQNQDILSNPDVWFMLTYATIMLNADMHNPAIAKRMTKEQFLRSLAGISNGGDLPDHFLEGIYERVSARSIITNDDDDGDGGGGGGASGGGGLIYLHLPGYLNKDVSLYQGGRGR